ncbi:MAG: hypothetical protein HY788_01295 [Deltaproteobacteria bacterium]|nr:hypothetical protein [Deltaproteobacteria bacterium]
MPYHDVHIHFFHEGPIDSFLLDFRRMQGFGGSRKKMAHFLSKYEHCYTDFSSLLPYMKKDPAAYRDFISSFPDRILFGSDALFGVPSMVKEYIEFADGFLDETLRDKVGRENYLRFHRPG